MKKFEETGSVEFNRRRVFNYDARLEENFVVVRASVGEILKVSLQVNIKTSNLHKILKTDLHLKLRIHLSQELTRNPNGGPFYFQNGQPSKLLM